MGEYAKLKGTGERVKIGTCENMYYLRADQATQVWAEDGNVDPIKDHEHIRFRFPWPEEDHIRPGDFEPFHALTLYGVSAPAEAEHGNVQFKADNGYLVSLPCPENVNEYDEGGRARVESDYHGIRIGRNGHGGASELVQQCWWAGRLLPVLQCKGCHHAWRLPEIGNASDLLRELHRLAENKRRDWRRNDTPGDLDRANYYDEIAARILAGYERLFRAWVEVDA